MIEGRAPYRSTPLGFYRPFTLEQQPVVQFFIENMEHRAVQRLVGDRKYVVPAGGVLFSRRRVAELLNLPPSASSLVKRTLDRLVQLERVELFTAYTEQRAPRVQQQPLRSGDPRLDPRGDQFFSSDHRSVPSLLIWQNLLVTFGMKGDAELARDERLDPRHDPRGDPRRDPREARKLRPVG